jgi:hypothetical protein
MIRIEAGVTHAPQLNFFGRVLRAGSLLATALGAERLKDPTALVHVPNGVLDVLQNGAHGAPPVVSASYNFT